MLQVYFLPFSTQNYSDCVVGSERCLNVDDLHSILCLKSKAANIEKLQPRDFLAFLLEKQGFSWLRKGLLVVTNHDSKHDQPAYS